MLCNSESCTARHHHYYFQRENEFFLDTKEYLGQTLSADITSTAHQRCSAAALLSQWTMGVMFFFLIILWLFELNCCQYKLCSSFPVHQSHLCFCWSCGVCHLIITVLSSNCRTLSLQSSGAERRSALFNRYHDFLIISWKVSCQVFVIRFTSQRN